MKKLVIFFYILLVSFPAFAKTQVRHFPDNNPIWVYNVPGDVSYTETDPVVKAINGIVKSNGSTISAAVAGVDYATPNTITAKTSNYTLTSSDSLVTGSGTFTFTLPTAVGISGKTYTIKNVGSGTIFIATTSGQTIDGNIIGSITSSSLASGGASYLLNGTCAIDPNNNGSALIVVNSLSGSSLATYTMENFGSGYSVATVDISNPNGDVRATLNILGISAYNLNVPNDVLTVMSDGSNWQIVSRDQVGGQVPIGAVIWFMDYYFVSGVTSVNGAAPSMPWNYVGLAGQVVTDTQSPMYGAQLPDVNGSGGQPRFLRGANLGSYTSGTAGGHDTSSLSTTITFPLGSGLSGGTYRAVTATGTATGNTVPAYILMPAIIRIK
jgi:hypothetical protein